MLDETVPDTLHPPSRKQEKSTAGGRLGAGWRVIKGCTLDMALPSRWTARRT